ncbi:MAG TPA: 3-isopropylmalate dehydratase small subunit [Longimicrobiales bacterium]
MNATTTTLRGRARVFARAHINTDEIIPARYLNTADEATLAAHVMEDIDPEFPATVRAGDIIVAGADFGCGSSREHAVWALRGAGVQAVIADSFARIFFRNAINNGFRVIECPGAAAAFQEGDDVVIDLAGGRVCAPGRGIDLAFVPPGEFAERLLAAGGLLPYVAGRVQARTAPNEAAPAGSEAGAAQAPSRAPRTSPARERRAPAGGAGSTPSNALTPEQRSPQEAR